MSVNGDGGLARKRKKRKKIWNGDDGSDGGGGRWTTSPDGDADNRLLNDDVQAWLFSLTRYFPPLHTYKIKDICKNAILQGKSWAA